MFSKETFIMQNESAEYQQLKREIKNIVKEVAGEAIPDNLTIIEYVQYLKDYLENIIGHIPCNVYWMDINNTYLGCNNLHAKNAGLTSRHEIRGKTNYDLAWKDQSEELHRINKKVITSGEGIKVEEHGVSETGAFLYITQKVPLRDKDNQIIGLMGLSLDITERKETEEEHLNLALQSLRIGTWEWDVGIDKFTHKYMHEEKPFVFTGTFEDTIERIHPADQQKVRTAIADTIKNNSLLENEHRIIWMDNTFRHVAFRGKAVHDAANNPIRLVGISWDITERKKMEEAIRQQEKELSQFTRLASMGEMASTLAHELNQPLTIISNYTKGCVRRLENSTLKKEELIEALNQASMQAIRASEIIHRMKNFISKGKLYYDSVNINSVIKEIVSIFQIEHISDVLEIETKFNENLPELQLDKVQIGQVILNLLRNGAEAMQEANIDKPKLIIESLMTGNFLQVNVIDNGPGFSPEIKSMLMNPYFTTKEKGMGMGLAICRTIIEAHGGQLTADNHPNGGAWFKFTLPLNS